MAYESGSAQPEMMERLDAEAFVDVLPEVGIARTDPDWDVPAL